MDFELSKEQLEVLREDVRLLKEAYDHGKKQNETIARLEAEVATLRKELTAAHGFIETLKVNLDALHLRLEKEVWKKNA